MNRIRLHFFIITIFGVLAIGLCLTAVSAENTVSYIDSNNTEQYCNSYTNVSDVLTTGAVTILSEGWYVVDEDVTIENIIKFGGTVNIILCDGAKLTAKKAIYSDDGVMNIYGQTKGTGELDAYCTVDFYTNCDYSSAIYAGKGLSINGGIVMAESQNGDGIGTRGFLDINGGRITIKSKCSGIGTYGDRGKPLRIKGGILDISSNTNCISGRGVSISGGEIVLHDSNNGICCLQDHVGIGGGKLTIKDNIKVGICTYSFGISGGIVDIEASIKGVSIYDKGGVAIYGGKAIIKGGKYGINDDGPYTLPSRAEFYGGDVTIYGNDNALNVDSVIINVPGTGWTDIEGSAGETSLGNGGNYNIRRFRKIVLTPHIHSWVYALEENKTYSVLAKCEGIGACYYKDHPYRVYMGAADKNYDGEANAASIVDYTANYITADNSDVSGLDPIPTAITYYRSTGKDSVICTGDALSSAPVNAGDYVAQMSWGGILAKVEYSINKVPATVVSEPTRKDNLEYSGRPMALINEGIADGGEFYYARGEVGNRDNPIEPYSKEIPSEIDPGTYWVWAYAKGDMNHTDNTNCGIIEVKIKKGKASYNVPQNITAKCGQVLGEVILPDGWEWENGYLNVGSIGSRSFKARYIPKDLGHYEVVEGIDVSIIVKEQSPGSGDNETGGNDGGNTPGAVGGGGASGGGGGSSDELTEVDKDAANKVVILINSLPAETTINDVNDVISAREAYDSLTDLQKGLISSKSFDTLKKSESDIVNAVSNMIKELPDTIKLEDKERVDEAIKAYSSLSDSLRSGIDIRIKDKLAKAQSTINECIEYNEEIVAAKNKTTNAFRLKAKAKKRILVTILSVSSNSAYQIRYSTNKKFKKSVKTKILKAGVKSITINKLKAKKKYYFQIRPIEYVINEATGSSTAVVGRWSKTKKVKT